MPAQPLAKGEMAPDDDKRHLRESEVKATV